MILTPTQYVQRTATFKSSMTLTPDTHKKKKKKRRKKGKHFREKEKENRKHRTRKRKQVFPQTNLSKPKFLIGFD